jgi:hypothetical protein
MLAASTLHKSNWLPASCPDRAPVTVVWANSYLWENRKSLPEPWASGKRFVPASYKSRALLCARGDILLHVLLTRRRPTSVRMHR